jgi:hypothetical protein
MATQKYVAFVRVGRQDYALLQIAAVLLRLRLQRLGLRVLRYALRNVKAESRDAA